MAGTYKQFRDINPDVIRNIIRGDNESDVQSEPTGIMSPSTSLRPKSRPADLDTGVADKAAIDSAVFGVIAEEIGKSSVDRNAVAKAVVPTSEPKEEVDLSEWESMLPISEIIGRSQTEQAIPTLPSSRGATPPLQYRETGIDFTAGAQPVAEQSGTWNSTNFADTILRRFEGTEAHESLEGGAATGAFGVKFSRGINREDYDSDLDFAAAVAQEHYNDVSSTFSSEGRDLSTLPVSVQNAIVDLNYNTGTIGSTAQKDSPEDMMRNTLDFIGVTTNDGTRGSLIALARRRAENWNAAAGDLGVARIATVEQVPTSEGGTTFRYLDADGNTVHSTTSNRKPITFTGGTSYRVNTQTRRVEID